MVKRDQIVPGKVVRVKKVPAGSPGIGFEGRLKARERLLVLSFPYTMGGLQLVKVKRLEDDREFSALYPFVTNFCEPEARR